MSNVMQFPRRKQPVALEVAIAAGLEKATAAGVTQKVLLFKVPFGYVATEDQKMIEQYLENDP